jgi:type IV secretion system protein VirB1
MAWSSTHATCSNFTHKEYAAEAAYFFPNMDYVEFSTYVSQCAPFVHPRTMYSVVAKESSFNPYAIAIVGKARLERQPRNYGEAVATAKALVDRGIVFSAGLSQVNYTNFKAYGLTIENVFQVCPNLAAGGQILAKCFERASSGQRNEQVALQAALSCYFSNNFVTGFKAGYVQRIVSHAYQQRVKDGLTR